MSIADLPERARELRRQGLSVRQIAEQLGGRSTSTIQDWVAGVPPPEWTRRPNAKDAEREQARRLRLDGLTYGEIAAALKVSKSSVSLWTRDLPHPTSPGQKLDARMAGAKQYFDLRRHRVHAERQAEKQAWADAIGELSERELLIAGAVAYWAEGSKAKPWRPSEQVVFINSDPGMITLFLAYLDLLGFEKDRLRFRVQIHESADVPAAMAYWAGCVGVTAEDLQRPTLKRHVPKTRRKNIGAGYHGCLTVNVLRSAELYRRIEGTWWAVRRAARSPSVPDPTSL